jgi:hypothetical protein
MSEAERLIAKATTLTEVVQILQRIAPPLSWANEDDIREELPTNPNLATIRSGVLRMLGHAKARREEADRNEELARREAAWRAANGKGRTRKTRKRKHFRKRTSRKH